MIRSTTDETVPPEARRLYMLVNKSDGVVGGRGNILSEMLYSLHELQARLDAAEKDPTKRPFTDLEQQIMLQQAYAGGRA